jgi:hypothetical protein
MQNFYCLNLAVSLDCTGLEVVKERASFHKHELDWVGTNYFPVLVYRVNH